MAQHTLTNQVPGMSGNDNVIILENNSRDGIARQVLTRRLLARFKDITNQHMRRIMQAMFDTADDALFKMSEHTSEGADKNLYFDSMRVVRLQRTTIEKTFFDTLSGKFSQYLDNVHGDDRKQTREAIDFDSLELVSEDDLEITLATQRLVEKIQSLYAQDLSAINKRMACLLNQEEIDSATIPFGADSIVNAYAQASANTDLMQEVRIILLKLFDLSCIHGLAELYVQINQEFIDADILPVIKNMIRNNANSNNAAMPASPQSTPAPVAFTPPTGDNLWSTLQGYLSQLRSTTPATAYFASANGAGSQAGNPGAIGLFANGIGPGQVIAFTPKELVTSLTSLQQNNDDALPTGAHAVGNYVRVQLQNISEDDDKAPRQINPVDNDLIDIVCLIFDYILDDEQLPETARTSIRRLQIPMLKVALLDKQFFSNHGHPARDLLDLLAQSALGIDEENEDDPVLNKIDGIVQRILNEFSDDIILFSELQQEFTSFLQTHRSRENELLTDIERRQQEREELALARAWVRETLEQHLLGHTLPGVVVDIILGPWKDVMLQTYLAEGEDSLLWKTQIRFIDVLAWSVEPKDIKLDKNKLGNIICQLTSTLRHGLLQLNYPQAEIDAIFAALEPYHLASVRGHPRHAANKAAALDQAIAITEAQYADMQAMAFDDETDKDKVVLEDIVLTGWEADPILDAISDEYLDLASHLEMGKWVEFLDEKGNCRHAKLAWKSELLGEYTFLNWKFDVVADKTLIELADDLRHGRARVMDDVPLMDRALSSVLTTLMPKST